MSWFLVGFICLATQCAAFDDNRGPYERPEQCLARSEELVPQIVERMREHGVTRVKTYCTLGEERRDKMLDALRHMTPRTPAPSAAGRDA